MVIQRTNSHSLVTSADSCFEAMQRHAARQPAPAGSRAAPTPPPLPSTGSGGDGSSGPGDVIYGARAIALHIFNDGSNRARRRVFNLWDYHRQRKEKAGFFKLKGAVCLSKSQWRKFHGLD